MGPAGVFGTTTSPPRGVTAVFEAAFPPTRGVSGRDHGAGDRTGPRRAPNLRVEADPERVHRLEEQPPTALVRVRGDHPPTHDLDRGRAGGLRRDRERT